MNSLIIMQLAVFGGEWVSGVMSFRVWTFRDILVGRSIDRQLTAEWD